MTRSCVYTYRLCSRADGQGREQEHRLETMIPFEVVRTPVHSCSFSSDIEIDVRLHSDCLHSTVPRTMDNSFALRELLRFQNSSHVTLTEL